MECRLILILYRVILCFYEQQRHTQQRQEQRGATKTGERRNENSKIIMIGETEGKKIRFLPTAKILGLYEMVVVL